MSSDAGQQGLYIVESKVKTTQQSCTPKVISENGPNGAVHPKQLYIMKDRKLQH